MHRDQKIGLSLAVLIIGFAGAFCFRNEPLSDPHPLALDQAAALDSRIEQLPVRAYTQREGVGGISAQPDVANTSADLVDASLCERPLQPMEVGAALTGDHIDLFAGPPEPLRTNESPATTGHDESRRSLKQPDAVLPVESHSPESARTAKSGLDQVVEHQPSQAALRTYVVQSGDTLSGVALKMYGTSRRYLDIYRANADILSDPNDLPVGTTLRIP